MKAIFLFAILLLNILAFAKDKRDENSPPDLTNWLVSPNGAESFAVGSSIAVTIDGALYTPPTVVVELYKGTTRVWGPSYAGISGRTISTVGLSAGSDYRVRIYNASNPAEEDYSNGFFSLSTTPSLSNWIVSPNGGESYPVGATIPVSINNALYNAGGAGIAIELFKGATKVWGPSIAGISGRTIPTTGLAAGSDYRVHIYNANNSTEEDYSNGNFSIVAPPPSLTNWIISPNGGESFASGGSSTVVIDGAFYNPGAVTVELYKGTTKVWGPSTAGVSERTFSTVGLSAGSDYRVRIYNASNPAEEDYSNSYFSISSSDINNWIKSPNGGESFTYGSIIPIDLSGYGANQAVGVDLYKGSVRVGGDGTGGNTDRKIVTSGMTLTAGTDYKVRVYLANDPSQEDWSNNFFTIVGSGTGGGGGGGGSGRPGPTTTGVIGCAKGTYTLRARGGYTGATPTGLKWFTSQFGSTELPNAVIDGSGFSFVSGSYTGYFSSSTTYWVATIYENNPSNLSQRSPVSFTIDPTSTACPAPLTPVVLPATLVSGSCFIANWQESSGATSYQLDVSTDNFSTFVSGLRNVTVDGTSISIGGLGAGNYQYRVRAVNSGGVSAYSQVFSFIVVCAGATSTPQTRLIDYNRITNESSECCGRGTIIQPSIIDGDNTIATLRGWRYNEVFSSPFYWPYNSQPAVVDVIWNPLRTAGYIKIQVDQNRRINNPYCDTWISSCDDRVSTMYYYDIYLANCSSCTGSRGPLTSNIYQSNDYGCGTQFRLFANYGNSDCQPTSYNWNFGDGQTSIESTPFHKYAAPGTYTVILNYKTMCNGYILAQGNTEVRRTITVTSALSSKLDFVSRDSECGTVFTPTPTYPDKTCNDVAYEWDFGDGSPKSTLSSPSHRYSRAGSYTVSLKLTYLCSGCQKFITYQKTITAPELAPIASFSQQYNSCTTTFSANINSNCTKTTYLWDFGDGITSTEAQPSHTYATAGVYSTSLTLGYQCSTGCSGQENITKPTIILAPKAPAIDFTFQNYKCETIFTSYVTHKNSACSTVSYLWDFGDGTSSADSNPSHLYSSAGVYNVSLTLTYQCGNTCPAQTVTSINRSVTHSAPPTATVDFTFVNYYCATRFLPTSSYSSNNCRSVSYRWDFGDGIISTDRSPLHAYTNPGSYNVLLRLSYQCNNGCPAEIITSKQITFTPTPATIENLLLTTETDVKYEVKNASVSTFSDSWSLSHDNANLSNKSSYLNGTHGVWRNNASYVYKTDRSLSPNTDLAKDGTFTMNQFDWGSAEFNIVPNWIQANTMTEYSPYSYELENQDVLGVYSAALYDYGGHLPSANGVNMRNKEMAFTSFEYEDRDKNGNLTGKPSGNWMLSNSETPASVTYKVPIASGHAVVVKASLEELDLVQKVDVNAEAFWFYSFFSPNRKPTAYLQDVDVLCKQAYPSNPNWSIIMLGRAPFEGLWYGKITVKKIVLPQVQADFDGFVAHSGKSSLKVTNATANKTFRQEMLELENGKTYWLNAWVRVVNTNPTVPKLADNLGIELTFKNKQGQVAGTASFQPVGTIIEGWQQVKGTFTCPIKNPLIEIKFKPGSTGIAWYDDLRLQPEKGNMKCYVYNIYDYRLQAILDEENYASFFYYDKEGNLYLTKKETEHGIKTITENVSYQVQR